MPNISPDSMPEWDSVLSSAAHLQRILPGAVLVGGTAAAAHAGHRLSVDAALADSIGDEATLAALAPFDRLYPQPNGQSALQQLQAQLANPLPFDLDETDLAHYKHLDPKWQDWESVKTLCGTLAVKFLDHFSA